MEIQLENNSQKLYGVKDVAISDCLKY